MHAVQDVVSRAATVAGQPLRDSTVIDYAPVPWYRYASGKFFIPWNELGVSEARGEKVLLDRIAADRASAAAAGCPDAPIMLAGYSQGAEVVVRAADSLSPASRKTISIALLGNPSFAPGRAQDLNFNWSIYQGVRPSFVAQRYSLSSDLVARAIDICAGSDPICAYHESEIPGLIDGRSAHYHYQTIKFSGISLTTVAANSAWAHRYKATPAPTPVPNPGPAPSPNPDPASPIFVVMNTSETPPDGVWFRNSPHTSDTLRITGLGVYYGERVQLTCYAFGDAVGPYADRLWYRVSNVTRQTVGGRLNAGYLNAHYINDGKAANVRDDGVPAC